MGRMKTKLTIGGAVGAALLLASPASQAQEPTASDGLWPIDHTDHHHRPAEYDDPDYAVPPVSGEPAEYPLAVGFTPAHSSNYTNGGLNSYDYVVVHTMQGYYGGSISWFQNPDANVSAHYVMRAEDGEVTQMVRNDDRAWHVGGSNSQALGIEHEGFIDDASWYTWETYLSSARLARWLCEEFEIPVDRDHIVGHVELPAQSHTDPGPLWDWDMYMALIRDVVPEGEIHGVVVDDTLACELTATEDTWIKTTLENSADLSDDERCLVPAGTTVRALHRSEDMIGHARLHFDAEDTPCDGALTTEGVAFLSHFDGACSPADMAAVGAWVSVDGGDPIDVDAEGRFVISGVAPGEHSLEIGADGYSSQSGSIDVEVYPGAWVVISLDPVPGGADESGDGDPDPDSGTGGDPPPGGTGGEDGPEPEPTSGGTAAEDDGGDGGRALPPGFGEDEGQGCGCRGQGRPAGLAWLFPLLLAGLRRRASRK